MEQKIVLFDMDGVLCQYDEKLLRLAHERFSLPLYLPHEVENFDTEEMFPERYRERVGAIADEEGYFKDLKPYPGVLDAFHEMAEDPRIKVFICTTPKRFYKSSACVAEKHGWIARFLGKSWTDKVILTRDKTLVHADILIDDKPVITGAITPSWTHVYHDRPYNRHINRPRITDWTKWKEVVIPILFKE